MRKTELMPEKNMWVFLFLSGGSVLTESQTLKMTGSKNSNSKSPGQFEDFGSEAQH